MNFKRYKSLQSIKDPIESINALLLLDDEELHIYRIIHEYENDKKNKLTNLLKERKIKYVRRKRI